jgi:hypothetical protein
MKKNVEISIKCDEYYIIEWEDFTEPIGKDTYYDEWKSLINTI